MSDPDDLRARLSRRSFIQRGAAAGAAVSLGGLLAACGDSDDGGSEAAPATSGGGATSQAPETQFQTGTAIETAEAAPTTGTTEAAEEIIRGGRLRVGHVGGGEAETFNPGVAASFIDASRLFNIYDRLVSVAPDLSLQNELAEEFVPNADATVWQIRLKSGITWHDGKDLTADDLVYTIRNGSDAKHAASSTFAAFDVKGIKKLDPLTISLPLKTPNARLQDAFTLFPMSIVQDGFKDYSKPIGTGAFKFVEFDVGKSSLMARNENYWLEGRPYVDELEDLSIADDTARLNALLEGDIDLMEQLPYAQARQHAGGDQIVVIDAPSPNILPILMACDLEPFKDVRVRQAMRLIADRQGLIDGALLGFGTVGNDLFGKGLPYFNNDLPQREQDLDQAKQLLKAAGAEGLEVTLHSSKIYPGMLESATLFAEQAKGAGVKVNVKEEPANSYFDIGLLYTKVNFGQSFWNAPTLSAWHEQSVLSDAVWNETHWKRPEFDKLVRQAQGELDQTKAAELWNEVQKVLYDEGGYLIWCYVNLVDAAAPNVRGVVPSGFYNLGGFDYRNYWLAAA
jgi:peptide/nickel transport system substrate-binding protein